MSSPPPENRSSRSRSRSASVDDNHFAPASTTHRSETRPAAAQSEPTKDEMTQYNWRDWAPGHQWRNRMTAKRARDLARILPHDTDWEAVALATSLQPDRFVEWIQRSEAPASASPRATASIDPSHTPIQKEAARLVKAYHDTHEHLPTMAQLVDFFQESQSWRDVRSKTDAAGNKTVSEVSRHATTKFLYEYMARIGYTLKATTDKSLLRKDAGVDIKKFLATVQHARHKSGADNRLGAYVNFDEVPIEFAPKNLGKLAVPPGHTARISKMVDKFKGGRCTAVLATVLQPTGSGGPDKWESRMLDPFFIFKGVTETECVTKLTPIRRRPDCALTPSSFMRTEILEKCVSWFREQIHTAHHIYWIYDNASSHNTMEAILKDKPLEHCIPGPPGCTWTWQPVDLGLGAKVQHDFAALTKKAIDTTPVDLHEDEGGLCHPLGIIQRFAKVTRVDTLSYWIRGGFIEPPEPRSKENDHHGYVGWEYPEVESLQFDPDKVEPQLFKASEWNAGPEAQDRLGQLIQGGADEETYVTLEDEQGTELLLPSRPRENLGEPPLQFEINFKKFVDTVFAQNVPWVYAALLEYKITNTELFKSQVECKEDIHGWSTKVWGQRMDVQKRSENDMHRACVAIHRALLVREAQSDRRSHDNRHSSRR